MYICQSVLFISFKVIETLVETQISFFPIEMILLNLIVNILIFGFRNGAKLPALKKTTTKRMKITSLSIVFEKRRLLSTSFV